MDFGKFEAAKEGELIHFGRLARAGEMARVVEGAAALRASAPVFVMTVDPAKLAPHVTGDAGIAFGAFESDTCVIVTVTVQLGGALFKWLADPTDSEVWKAIDNMRHTEQIAFSLESDSDSWLQPFVVRSKLGIDKYRRELGVKGKSFLPEALARITSGLIHEGDPSIIAGRPVNYSQVAILATRGVVVAAEKLHADFSAWNEARNLRGETKQ
ncbi:hypothetical protein [Paraburkholderia caribensis]|uniref:hypothetical protein n=1 Tax=Paraburkholderia caribensis TaxID=75105 RepID=UPI0031DA32C5